MPDFLHSTLGRGPTFMEHLLGSLLGTLHTLSHQMTLHRPLNKILTPHKAIVPSDIWVISLTILLHLCSSPAILDFFFLFMKHTQHIPASGVLHLSFPLPGMLFAWPSPVLFLLIDHISAKISILQRGLS